MAHTKSAGKMLRGGAVALAAAACLALNACGNQNENPPQTATPTTIESESPATWPDGSPILPGDQTDIYGERVTGREDETGPTDPESATGTENESATTTQENEPAAGSPAGSLPTAEILKGVPGAATRTGLQPLPVRKMEVPDPNNSRNLPTKKIEHAYGAAKNGVPHQISIDNQRFFNTKRYAAVAYDDQTKDEKVLYLTFDCGYENGNTAKILDVLKEKQVPAAFFCTVDELKRAPDVVARMINEGHIVGNHSVSHPSFAAIDRTAMAKEILEADNYLRENF
ncbi:MAG: polysaccharide deacetylase family protein, partial [Oscillospiraceae bacterium]|nr:polysaccharide deacetylase family protein [Oscillospiraceae bacterium]